MRAPSASTVCRHEHRYAITTKSAREISSVPTDSKARDVLCTEADRSSDEQMVGCCCSGGQLNELVECGLVLRRRSPPPGQSLREIGMTLRCGTITLLKPGAPAI